MERGKKFEQKVGSLFSDLEARYPQWVKVFPQFPVELKSGRKVFIDFKLAIEFPHEFQNYYFELQSRNIYDHALADKVEAIRRDTALTTFSFVHETELGESVAAELKSRNIIPKDWSSLKSFVEGIELQLLQQASAQRIAQGREAHDAESGSRLQHLVKKLAETQGKKHTREVRGGKPSSEEKEIVEDIVKEALRNPDEAIRQARKFFGF